MTTLPLSRLLLAVTLLAACSKAEAESGGLPPARPGGAAPTIPGPPPKPAAAAATNNPGLAAKVGQSAKCAQQRDKLDLGFGTQGAKALQQNQYTQK